ncbi:hypothetical protein XU18_3110 [Perkinsela sp. CCAP 1560/4]|nr:hypothetical protein XU18_3110 [Perkinsela sp. CCAP 1560/4]|eukprot:KNH05948.1 hypothetical protein XU18_3110 [Perkinsela sp. CCAP 1560/4]
MRCGRVFLSPFTSKGPLSATCPLRCSVPSGPTDEYANRAESEADVGFARRVVKTPDAMERQKAFLKFLCRLSVVRPAVYAATQYDSVRNEGRGSSYIRAALKHSYSSSPDEKTKLEGQIKANKAHNLLISGFVEQARTLPLGSTAGQWMTYGYFLFFHEEYSRCWRACGPHPRGFFMKVAREWHHMEESRRMRYEKAASVKRAMLEKPGRSSEIDGLHIQATLQETPMDQSPKMQRVRKVFLHLLEIRQDSARRTGEKV